MTAKIAPRAAKPAAKSRTTTGRAKNPLAAANAKTRASSSTKGKAAPARPKAPAATTRRTVKAKGPSRAKRQTQPRPGPPHPGPTEASYSSLLFRSRTEARWAIFFDLMGWSWDYEPCHYSLGALNYLPDFYLPDADIWVEVKGPSFLDAGSMGKVASAAAGPHPLPSRRPPYERAAAVVLVGPMPDPAQGRPVHQLVAPTGTPRVAGFTRAVWEADGTVRPVESKPWLTVPATGDKPARRPTAARAAEILLPPGAGRLGMHPALQRAYEEAARVRFDDVTHQLARTTPAGLQAELALRRAGRPLGCAA